MFSLLRPKPSKSIKHLPPVPQTSIDASVTPQGYLAALITTLGTIADRIDDINPKKFPEITWQPEGGTAKEQQRTLCDMIVEGANRRITDACTDVELPSSKVQTAKNFHNRTRNEFQRPLLKAISKRGPPEALDMGDYRTKLEALLADILEEIMS